jgi:hypothetical protein
MHAQVLYPRIRGTCRVHPVNSAVAPAAKADAKKASTINQRRALTAATSNLILLQPQWRCLFRAPWRQQAATQPTFWVRSRHSRDVYRCPLYLKAESNLSRVMSALCQKRTSRCFARSFDRRAVARNVEQTAQTALTVVEMRVLGHGFVLDCTNDGREYCAASATGKHLRYNTADTQIAGLCCSHDRWQR